MRASLAILLGIILLLPAAFAATPIEEIDFDIEGSIDENVYGVVGNTQITRPINGDLALAAENVEVNSIISEDVTIAASTITINAPIGDDATLFAKRVIINSDVGGDARIFAQQIGIAPQATIGGDVILVAQEVDHRGTVNQEAIIAASDVRLSGVIQDDARIESENIQIIDTASVGGDLQLIVKELRGNAQQITQGEYTQTTKTGQIVSSGIWFDLASFITFLILGSLAITVFPKLKQKGQTLKNNKAKSTLLGLLFYAITPLIILLFVLTLVGIPIAILLGIIIYLLVYFAKLPVSLRIGQIFVKNAYWQLIIGWLILRILISIPYIGWIFAVATGIMGVGALLVPIASRKSIEGSKKADKVLFNNQ